MDATKVTAISRRVLPGVPVRQEFTATENGPGTEFAEQRNRITTRSRSFPLCFAWCPVKLAYLTETAALMAAHGRLFAEQHTELSAQIIGDYYILSRNRFNRWMKDLSDIENGLSIRDPLQLIGLTPSRPAARMITEHILVNEMLARVWTVLMMARDRYQNTDRVHPVAHNVFLGHLSVRHKALSVVLTDSRLHHDDLVAIDKLRRATERWTDLLCCSLMGRYDLWKYAFNEETAREFYEERRNQQSMDHRSRVWVLILAGMRHTFQQSGDLTALVQDDDRRLVRLMLDSFPEDSDEMTFWMNAKVQEARRI